MGKFIITEEDKKNIRGLYEQFNQELDFHTTNNDQVENPHKEELINKLNNIDTKMEKLYNDLTNSGNPIDKKRFMYQLRNDVEGIIHNMMEDPNIDRNQFNELNNLFSEKYHEMIDKYRNMMR
jgi:TATA-binding protein-associated factor Taf7